MRARSHPRSRSTGQSMSANCAAKNRVPSDVLGAARLGRERDRVVAEEQGMLLALGREQRVVLLALAQEHVAPREPVRRLESALDVLHARLIDVDPALLELAAGLTLRPHQPAVYQRVDQSEPVG